MRLNQVTVPALDVERSIAFYKTLGLRLIVQSPDYARFELPDGESTFSIHRAADPGRAAEGSGIYFECDDLDARVAALKAKGIRFDAGPADQSWLWREAWLTDPAGVRLCLYKAGENRRYPPWRLKD
ncbi:MAG TPA: VOC family protein [Rhizomicrobium sp.]|nr:VOC family protein [Rhizomicrobium sp.]